jgi:hypothetical protein
MKTLAAFILFLFLSAAACQNEDNQSQADEIVDLNYKESKYIQDQTISISLDSVLNDSRCPNGAACVWVGNAAVRFSYTRETQNSFFVLNTFANFRTDTLLDGYRIKLVQLNPYPQLGHLPIKQSEYKAELKVTKE